MHSFDWYIYMQIVIMIELVPLILHINFDSQWFSSASDLQHDAQQILGT